MANNYINPTKVITGVNTRWSYANVWDAKSINGGAPKYSVSLIIPKSDTATVNKINKDLGVTVIITEHRLEEVFTCADRVVVMDNGKIIADASPESIGEKAKELPFVYPAQIPVNDPKYHITTQKRPLAVYAKVGGQV